MTQQRLTGPAEGALAPFAREASGALALRGKSGSALP